METAHSTLIIAEVGVNHNGDPALAHELIDVAGDAGADVVKFQTFRPGSIVSEAAPTASYQRRATGKSSQRAMLDSLVLAESTWAELAAHCAERNVEFLSTAFDMESLELLIGLGIGRIKIPSGEVNNIRFVRSVAAIGLPLLISTGMSTWNDVTWAVEQSAAATDRTLLHCVSLYPTPPELTNLAAMAAMGRRYGLPIGWSDHTLGNQSALMATALGATVIEKHITLDRSLQGPDHAASADPDGFRNYVSAIRLAEAMMGSPEKRPVAGEIEMATAARRSHHATGALHAGDVLTERDTELLRPATGAPASEELSGRRLIVDVSGGDPVRTEFLEPL